MNCNEQYETLRNMFSAYGALAQLHIYNRRTRETKPGNINAEMRFEKHLIVVSEERSTLRTTND